MPRFGGALNVQRQLLISLLESGASVDRLAGSCQVHPRTVRDWRRGKYRASKDAMERMFHSCGLPMPSEIAWLPDFWHVERASRLGGQQRFARHGPFGTPESCRRGGLAAQEHMKREVLSGRPTRFVFRKPVQIPDRDVELAEFVGIMLGDGSLANRYQAVVSFLAGGEDDYARFVAELIERLFGIRPTIGLRPPTKAGTVTASSRALVEHLVSLGLEQGNKVARQVNVPTWVTEDPDYRLACLRGLMDTDGSVYAYRHRVQHRDYQHAALCFTNHSRPLMEWVTDTFRCLGFHPSNARYNVYLHRLLEIKQYMAHVGSHNPRHLARYHSCVTKR